MSGSKVLMPKGLGYTGKRLIDIKSETEERFRETSCYSGLSEFTLKKENPLRYEILHARLLSSVIGAREAGRQIAASPVTREVAELCVVLFTPEGDAVTYSTGIMIHVQCMGRTIKWMIEQGYEDNPGLREGDLFECNDMLIGGVHTPDVYTITPVFWEEELIGWAGTVTHEMDVGGIVPGCMPTPVADRFSEGMRLCAEKVGENDTIWNSYKVRVRHSVRNPDIWLIDAGARASASLSVRNDVKHVVHEFGIDYYMLAIRELIEEERLAQLDRTKERLFPGRYREASFIDVLMSNAPVLSYAKRDYLTHIPVQIVVNIDGTIHVDLDGSSSWGYHSMNSAPGSIEGGIQLILAQTLAYDGRLNSGTMLATSMHLPQGAWCNPDYPYYATANAWSTVCPFGGLSIKCLSRAFYARGYREEIMTSGGGTAYHEYGGVNQYGQYFGCPNLEMGFGMGARAVADGLDVCYAFWNTESDMGNAEVWEFVLPLIYLDRNLLPNVNGYGKFRAGDSLGSVFMIHNSSFVLVSEMPVTAQHRVLHNGGLFGGYPGSAFFDRYARITDVKERIERQTPILGDGRDPDITTMGKESGIVPHVWVSPVLQETDLFMHRYVSGAGGYGDVIERDPELVRNDLENAVIDRKSAETVYGVVAGCDPETKEWGVSEEATNALRGQMLEERSRKAIPVRQWWEKTRQRLLNGQLDSAVLDVYRDSFRLSPNFFAQEFRLFWALHEDFEP